MPESAPLRARERVRAELTREISDTARRQLREVGASSLSMRAVAQELGMASSAIYRYFPSREELITALILDSYNALGAICEKLEATIPREDLRGRWVAVTNGIRDWAKANPHEYSLIYGTPIPGYKAPSNTILAAGRVTDLLFGILSDVNWDSNDARSQMSAPLKAELTKVRSANAPQVPEEIIVLGLAAWTQIIGTISLELYGHFNNVIDDGAAYFEHVMGLAAEQLGI